MDYCQSNILYNFTSKRDGEIEVLNYRYCKRKDLFLLRKQQILKKLRYQYFEVIKATSKVEKGTSEVEKASNLLEKATRK